MDTFQDPAKFGLSFLRPLTAQIKASQQIWNFVWNLHRNLNLEAITQV